MTRRPNNSTRRPGAAAIELALLVPLLVLLFAGTVDLARMMHATQVLENSAYAGALAASGTVWTPGYPATATDAARAAACAEGPACVPCVRPADVTVTVSGGTATVTVACDYPLATGIIYPSATVRLERTVAMPVAPRPGD